jgi:hypothetical protein
MQRILHYVGTNFNVKRIPSNLYFSHSEPRITYEMSTTVADRQQSAYKLSIRLTRLTHLLERLSTEPGNVQLNPPLHALKSEEGNGAQ